MALTQGTVSYDYVDYGGNHSATSFRIDPAATATDLETIATDLEAISNAKICRYTITLVGSFSGKATAGNAQFADAATKALLQYIAAGGCDGAERINIPAPKVALFAGSAGDRIVLPTYAALATLNTDLNGVMVSKNGATGLTYLNGVRTSKVLPKIVLG